MRQSSWERGLLIGLVLIGFYFWKWEQVHTWYINRVNPPIAVVPTEQPGPSTTSLPGVTGTPGPKPTATSTLGGVNLSVPFSSQAPRGDWSLPYQEACEETSALLVNAYWQGQKPTVSQVEAEINRLVAWEQAAFGYYKHTTAQETARMIREVYGYKKVEVITSATIEDIATQVRAGRPVIVPLAGRLLGNPYYTSPGPVYHMMVVKGIAANGDIITNDVGTSHGYNLTYDPSVFLNAMHDVPTGGDDWPFGVTNVNQYIKTGKRVIIVVYPNE